MGRKPYVLTKIESLTHSISYIKSSGKRAHPNIFNIMKTHSFRNGLIIYLSYFWNKFRTILLQKDTLIFKKSINKSILFGREIEDVIIYISPSWYVGLSVFQ